MREPSQRAARSAPSALQPRGAGPAEQVGHRQRDVGRRAQDVVAERLAVQPQRAGEGVGLVDERRDLVVARKDVAVDAGFDDRRRLVPGQGLQAAGALSGLSRGCRFHGRKISAERKAVRDPATSFPLATGRAEPAYYPP